jgi:hypothetical protein
VQARAGALACCLTCVCTQLGVGAGIEKWLWRRRKRAWERGGRSSWKRGGRGRGSPVHALIRLHALCVQSPVRLTPGRTRASRRYKMALKCRQKNTPCLTVWALSRVPRPGDVKRLCSVALSRCSSAASDHGHPVVP